MKIRASELLLITLLVLLSFYCFNLHNDLAGKNKKLIEYEEKVNNDAKYNRFLESVNQTILKKELQLEQIKVKDGLTFWGNDSTKQFLLSKILDRDKLIFYFSNNTCHTCIISVIKQLSEVFPDFKNKEDIIFISSNIPKRIRNNYEGKKILNFEFPDFFDENLEMPVFFILDTSLHVKSACVFNKFDPTKTFLYLNSMQNLI